MTPCSLYGRLRGSRTWPWSASVRRGPSAAGRCSGPSPCRSSGSPTMTARRSSEGAREDLAGAGAIVVDEHGDGHLPGAARTGRGTGRSGPGRRSPRGHDHPGRGTARRSPRPRSSRPPGLPRRSSTRQFIPLACRSEDRPTELLGGRLLESGELDVADSGHWFDQEGLRDAETSTGRRVSSSTLPCRWPCGSGCRSASSPRPRAARPPRRGPSRSGVAPDPGDLLAARAPPRGRGLREDADEASRSWALSSTPRPTKLRSITP